MSNYRDENVNSVFDYAAIDSLDVNEEKVNNEVDITATIQNLRVGTPSLYYSLPAAKPSGANYIIKSTSATATAWALDSGGVYDQSLNTTDDVNFKTVNTTQGVAMGALSYPYVDDTVGKCLKTNGAGILSLQYPDYGTLMGGPNQELGTTANVNFYSIKTINAAGFNNFTGKTSIGLWAPIAASSLFTVQEDQTLQAAATTYIASSILATATPANQAGAYTCLYQAQKCALTLNLGSTTGIGSYISSLEGQMWASGTVPYYSGQNIYMRNYSTGTTTSMSGVHTYIRNEGTGTINSLAQITCGQPYNSGGGNITNVYGLKIEPQALAGSSSYGLYASGASDLNYISGKFSVGTVLPTANTSIFEVNQTETRQVAATNYFETKIIQTVNPTTASGTISSAYIPQQLVLNLNMGSSTGSSGFAQSHEMTYNGTGSCVHMTGVQYYMGNTSTGTLTSQVGVKTLFRNTSSGVITNQIGVHIPAPLSNTGTISNNYAIKIDNQAVGTITNNYGIHITGAQRNYFNGQTSVGTVLPSASSAVFEVNDTLSSAVAATEYVSNGCYSTCNPTTQSGALSSSYIANKVVSSGTLGTTTGIVLTALYAEANTITTGSSSLIGIQGNAFHKGGTTTTSAIGLNAKAGIAAVGTLTNSYAVMVQPPVKGGGGALTTSYGVYIQNQITAGTTTWGFYSTGLQPNHMHGSLVLGNALTVEADTKLTINDSVPKKDFRSTLANAPAADTVIASTRFYSDTMTALQKNVASIDCIIEAGTAIQGAGCIQFKCKPSGVAALTQSVNIDSNGLGLDVFSCIHQKRKIMGIYPVGTLLKVDSATTNALIAMTTGDYAAYTRPAGILLQASTVSGNFYEVAIKGICNVLTSISSTAGEGLGISNIYATEVMAVAQSDIRCYCLALESLSNVHSLLMVQIL